MALLNLNLSNQEELGSFSALPPGDYCVVISDSEIKESKAGEQHILLTYTVQDGPRHGDTVFDRLFLWHHDPKTVNFAQRRLKSIAIACGHQNPNFISDTSELHGRYMVIHTDVREYNGNTYTDIKSYRPIDAAQSSAAPKQMPQGNASPRPVAPPVPPPAASAPPVKPWE